VRVDASPVGTDRVPRTVLPHDALKVTAYDEHDFGAFEAAGRKMFFKIDHYNKRLNMHSPDPSDPLLTGRVITIMLAEEY
jgi:hypothetical protein